MRAPQHRRVPEVTADFPACRRLVRKRPRDRTGGARFGGGCAWLRRTRTPGPLLRPGPAVPSRVQARGRSKSPVHQRHVRPGPAPCSARHSAGFRSTRKAPRGARPSSGLPVPARLPKWLLDLLRTHGSESARRHRLSEAAAATPNGEDRPGPPQLRDMGSARDPAGRTATPCPTDTGCVHADGALVGTRTPPASRAFESPASAADVVPAVPQTAPPFPGIA